MKTGIDLIADERRRQLEVEGFSIETDLRLNTNEELARAAAFYAHPDQPDPSALFPRTWEAGWAKRRQHDRIRQLAIAGALCAAEIDRLQGEIR